jgi:hypothetical protein
VFFDAFMIPILRLGENCVADSPWKYHCPKGSTRGILFSTDLWRLKTLSITMIWAANWLLVVENFKHNDDTGCQLASGG